MAFFSPFDLSLSRLLIPVMAVAVGRVILSKLGEEERAPLVKWVLLGRSGYNSLSISIQRS